MRKVAISTLALMAVAMTSVAPAGAEDTKEMLKNTAWLPVKTLAIGSGMVVGTPIAVTRQVAERSIGFTQSFADNIGGKDSLPPVLFASILGVPFGVVAGSAEGVYFGGKNAIKYGVEKPFSPESFSLGEELE